jgi:hypothetical protein
MHLGNKNVNVCIFSPVPFIILILLLLLTPLSGFSGLWESLSKSSYRKIRSMVQPPA